MKRKSSTHIILIPRLMTPIWLKQCNKAADCIFHIPASHPFWPSSKFEPLFVAILFPYIRHRPFQLKSTPKMFQMARYLCKVFQDNKLDGGSILRQFLLDIGNIPTMSRSMVWKLLYLGGEPPFPRELSSDDGQDQEPARRKRKDYGKQRVENKRTRS